MAKKDTKNRAAGLGKEFKGFIMKGNVMDMAVGIIIGIAFGAVITSMVNDVLMPPIGLALGGADFKESFVVLKEGSPHGPYPSLANATAAGATTLRYGAFINTIINFIIIAFCIFMIVKVITNMRKKEEAEKAATEKDCPHCQMKVPIKATKCGHCTSEIPADVA
jgi:large conductance mechanosensitive channel